MPSFLHLSNEPKFNFLSIVVKSLNNLVLGRLKLYNNPEPRRRELELCGMLIFVQKT